jgi:hypothetical protein
MQLTLESDKLDKKQAFVQAYMIRGLVITRIFYMIELWKKNVLMQEAPSQSLIHCSVSNRLEMLDEAIRQFMPKLNTSLFWLPD